MIYNIYYTTDGFDFVLYQDLSEEHLDKVLSYRNHENVRKWMFNTEMISAKEHLSFISKLKGSSKVYCAVFRKQKIVACVNFDDIGNSEYFVGHFLNPRLLASGIGLYFEYAYLNFFFKHLKAKVIKASVKKQNYPMIKIHRLCDFKEIDRENSIYLNYEFSSKNFKAIPNSIEDFVNVLTNKYLEK
jgi:UDP-4-amino-4,6-dideoxy-N-acetyl-beta-L-altrosamine N-acetyltransferase